MIGCLRTRVRKQPIVALYFESELVLKFYNLEARYQVNIEVYEDKMGQSGDRNAIQMTYCWWDESGTRFELIYSAL